MTASQKKEPTASQLMNALVDVVDPDLGISIIDLGLVYDIRIHDRRVNPEVRFALGLY